MPKDSELNIELFLWKYKINITSYESLPINNEIKAPGLMWLCHNIKSKIQIFLMWSKFAGCASDVNKFRVCSSMPTNINYPNDTHRLGRENSWGFWHSNYRAQPCYFEVDSKCLSRQFLLQSMITRLHTSLQPVREQMHNNEENRIIKKAKGVWN